MSLFKFQSFCLKIDLCVYDLYRPTVIIIVQLVNIICPTNIQAVIGCVFEFTSNLYY